MVDSGWIPLLYLWEIQAGYRFTYGRFRLDTAFIPMADSGWIPLLYPW